MNISGAKVLELDLDLVVGARCFVIVVVVAVGSHELIGLEPGLDESGVDVVPARVSRAAQESVDVVQVAAMERIVRVVLDHAQVGDVLAREALPRRCVGQHEVGVYDEERERHQQADDHHLNVE